MGRECGTLQEIVDKRFRHKRAIEVDGVMVELLLVERDGAGFFTNFWGLSRLRWPPNVFGESAIDAIPVASADALQMFRRSWNRLPSYDDLALAPNQAGVLEPLACHEHHTLS
jgi:hypothetical protein